MRKLLTFLIALATKAKAGLNGLYAVAQPSKIIERLNFQRLRRFRNFDDKDLALILFHSLMNVREMDEVVFRDQGVFARILVVDGDRPSCAHRNFPQNYLTRDCEQRLSLFLIAAETRGGAANSASDIA